jgi:YidC/Oxa1 family membrane protein insertase
MDKRLLLAVVVSMGILFLWMKFFAPAQPARAPMQQPTATAPSSAGIDSGVPAPAASATGQAEPGAKAPGAPAVRPAEELVTLESADAAYVLSTYGASLRQIKLKDRQFLKNAADPSSGMQIVSTSGENTAPLRIAFAKADFALGRPRRLDRQPSERR